MVWMGYMDGVHEWGIEGRPKTLRPVRDGCFDALDGDSLVRYAGVVLSTSVCWYG